MDQPCDNDVTADESSGDCACARADWKSSCDHVTRPPPPYLEVDLSLCRVTSGTKNDEGETKVNQGDTKKKVMINPIIPTDRMNG